MKTKKNINFVERVNLLIKFDSSKTLSENEKNLNAGIKEQEENWETLPTVTVVGKIFPLKLGRKGKYVKELQRAVGAPQTGYFNSQTDKAVRLKAKRIGVKYDSKDGVPRYLFELLGGVVPTQLTEPSEPSGGLSGVGGMQAGTLGNTTNREYNYTKRDFDKPYPMYCSYPNRAITPPKNKAGVEGGETIPIGKCAYPAPLPNYDPEGVWQPKITAVFIPVDSVITFNDLLTQKEILQKLQNMDPKVKKNPMTINYVVNCFPAGSVYKFGTPFGDYETRFVKGGGHEGFYTFQWYYNTLTNQPYPTYETYDPRTEYKRVLDNWGPTIQLVMSVAFLVGRSVARNPYVLAAEIIFELGSGLLLAQRDLERGRNLSAAFNLIFAVMPFLVKATPIFRGVNPANGRALVRSMNKAGITAQSKQEDVLRWFIGLPDDQAQLFSKVLQSGDELTEAMIEKSIGEGLESLQKLIKANPNKYQKIAAMKNIQNLEFGLQMSVLAIDFLLDSIAGEKLTDKNKERFTGIYNLADEIDASLAKEFADNIILNVEKANEILSDERIIEVQNSLTSGKAQLMNSERLNQQLADTFNDYGVWVDDPSNPNIAKNLPITDDVTLKNWLKENPSYKSEDEMKAQDWNIYKFKPIAKNLNGKTIYFWSKDSK